MTEWEAAKIKVIHSLPPAPVEEDLIYSLCSPRPHSKDQIIGSCMKEIFADVRFLNPCAILFALDKVGRVSPTPSAVVSGESHWDQDRRRDPK